MNRKMLVIILSLCLIIGVGVAGTVMMTGGSDTVGCEVEFSADQVTLYRAVDGESSMSFDVASLPSPVTISEELEGADGSVWYGLTGEDWHNIVGEYTYIKALDCKVIEKVEQAPIEAVELTGDIVINSEDTQLSAEIVDDSKVAEIESGLSIPVAEENVSRETYCFDIHAEKDETTTVSVSGIAKPGSTVNVYHMYDEDDYTQYEALPCTVKEDGTVTFETDSFSEFYFTVDFHNGDKVFSIEGMSSVLLSEVFSRLEIEENALDATSVVFSDPSLISIEQQDNGDWLLTSLAAFNTEETLTVTFSDGHQYVMTVTDATMYTLFDSPAIKIWWYTTDLALSSYGQNVKVYAYDPNSSDGKGALLASDTTKHDGANGTHFHCESYESSDPNAKYYLFYVAGTGNKSYNTVSNKTSETPSRTAVILTYRGGRVQPKYRWMDIVAVEAQTWDTGYCTIKQMSTFSTGYSWRNVRLEVWDYDAGGYVTKWTSPSVIFNDKDMDTGDLDIRNIDKSKFENASISFEGSTYVVRLKPYLVDITAKELSKDTVKGTALAGKEYGTSGISNVYISGDFYHKNSEISNSKSCTAKVLIRENFTLRAELKDDYVFDGWYDQNGKKVSSDLKYTAQAVQGQPMTYYARAVEKRDLYVDCYYRAANGRYGAAWGIDGSSDGYRLTLTGSDISNYYENGGNWYVIANKNMSDAATYSGSVRIKTVTDFYGNVIRTLDDPNATVVGLKNPNDKFYTNTGRPYYGSYTTSDGRVMPFWKAGVGLDIAPLDYVYFDAGTEHLSDPVWRYGYQWSYSTWSYDIFNRTWTEHPHQVSYPATLPGIPVIKDPGRINFVYKEEKVAGDNNFYLRYHANGLGISNVPATQSELDTNQTSYWFTVQGLSKNIVGTNEDGVEVSATPTRKGHTFVGWSTNRFHDPSDTTSSDIWTSEKFNQEIKTDADFNNRQIEVKLSSILPHTGIGNLYAIWDKNSNDITVTYHWNDGRDGDDTYKTQTFTKGHYLNLTDKPADPTREGYTFAGWYYDEDCNEDSAVKWVDVTDNKLYGDTEVYARWTVKITGKSMVSLGDKKGDQTIGGGIKEIKITDNNVNDIDKSLLTKKSITGSYDAYEVFRLEVVVNDGYRFIGWYDSNAVDSQGRPTGNLVSTNPVLSGKATKNTTYYARAVEESLLAVDYYVRLSNGRFVYASDWQTNRMIYGVEVTKDYSSNHNWYLIANYGLISDGTKEGTVKRVFKDDTNAMLIGTANPNDTAYSEYHGFKTSYFQDKTQGHYDFRYYGYKESDGSITQVPFKKAGVGLDFVTLNNVYYDADMRSSGSKISGQTWKYGYQWTTSYWTYTIKGGWQEHKINWELEDIPIYEDEGRVNFVYEKETKAGDNSFYLYYHSNLDGSDFRVRNIPGSQSKLKIDEQSYWFGVAGLVPSSAQPKATARLSSLGKTATFVGWSTNPQHDPNDPNGMYTPGKYYDDLDNQQIEVKLNEGSNNGTCHLYAIWKITKNGSDVDPTLTFDLNYSDKDQTSAPDKDNPDDPDVSNIWKQVTVPKGTCVDLKGEQPTRSGYVFAGWYSTRSCDPGTEFDVPNTPINTDGTVYAKWLPTYTVHYYYEGTTDKAAPDKISSDGYGIGAVVTEDAINIANCKLVGEAKKSLTIGNDVKENVIIFYYSRQATYTVNYYKDSVSDGNFLDSVQLPGIVGDVITLNTGTEPGQLDYKRPQGYKSGEQVEKDITVASDNSAVVNVVYKPDIASYTVECYIMNTDGSYSSSPNRSESGTGQVGSTATADTGVEHWITDGDADAFAFDKANPNNVTSATIKGDGSTVLKVYLSRNQYTLTWVVTKDDDGSYRIGDSVKYYYNQKITQATVDIPDHYDFDNWAKGGVQWPERMPKHDVSIAGELIRQRTDLVISKSGMKSGETAIFTVTGKGLGSSGLTVMVQNGESVTVKGLAVGESYTITEGGWSWKYEATAPVSRTLTNGSIEKVSFNNIPKSISWLTDEFYKDNKFGA